MSTRRLPHGSGPAPCQEGSEQDLPSEVRGVRHVHVFVALHMAAAGLIYLLAVIAGGGLGGTPWPPDERGQSRTASPAAVTPAPVHPAPAKDPRPHWLAHREADLEMRNVPDIRPRGLDGTP